MTMTGPTIYTINYIVFSPYLGKEDALAGTLMRLCCHVDVVPKVWDVPSNIGVPRLPNDPHRF